MTSHFHCPKLKIHPVNIVSTPINFYENNFQNILQVFPFWIPCLWMSQDILRWIVILVVLGSWRSQIRSNWWSNVNILTLILGSWKNIALPKRVWITGFYYNKNYTSLTKVVVPYSSSVLFWTNTFVIM
jgi:hypothetical protein